MRVIEAVVDPVRVEVPADVAVDVVVCVRLGVTELVLVGVPV